MGTTRVGTSSELTRTVLLRAGTRTPSGQRYTLDALIGIADSFNRRAAQLEAVGYEPRGRCEVDGDALVWWGPLQAQVGAMHFLPDADAALPRAGLRDEILAGVELGGRFPLPAPLPPAEVERVVHDLDEQRIGYRGDDSIPNPPRTGPDVVPMRDVNGRNIGGIRLPDSVANAIPHLLDRAHRLESPFERPLPVHFSEGVARPRSWSRRHPGLAGALWVLRILVFGLAFISAVVLGGKALAELLTSLGVVTGMAIDRQRRGRNPERDERIPVQQRSTGSRLPSVVKLCRDDSCRAEIVFLRYTKRTDDGARESTLPVNLTPEAKRRAEVGEPWQPRHPELVSHHATCPAAERFRRERSQRR